MLGEVRYRRGSIVKCSYATSRYVGPRQAGYFLWEIQEAVAAPTATRGQLTLYIFNDNVEDRLTAIQGGSNAQVRPYSQHGAHAALPHATGITTGSLHGPPHSGGLVLS